jgi:hypothetical protein
MSGGLDVLRAALASGVRMTARVIPTILRRSLQRHFTYVMCETSIVGMTLAVILEASTEARKTGRRPNDP